MASTTSWCDSRGPGCPMGISMAAGTPCLVIVITLPIGDTVKQGRKMSFRLERANGLLESILG